MERFCFRYARGIGSGELTSRRSKKMKCKKSLIGMLLMGSLLVSNSSFIVAEEPAKKPVVKKKYRTLKPKTKAATTATVNPPAKSQTGKKTSLQGWLNKMKKKIARAETKHNKLVAVASVRGDDSAEAPPLYWKGKSSQGPVALPELKEFEEAINLALNGDKAGSTAKLQSFVSAYPQSSLLADAQETLNALAAETPAP